MTSSSLNVLVTGGAKRIGREIALFMARQGWNVAVHYRTSHSEAETLVKEIHALGRGAVAVQADLNNVAALGRLVTSASETMGPLSCLINNASAFEKDTLGNFSDTSWDANMGANLHAPLALIRDFAAQYHAALSKDMSGGHIINMVDGVWGWSISSHFLSYSLSKMGLWTATQLLARELAPRIRINAIAPGPTLPGLQDKKHTFEKLREASALKRTTGVNEICDAINFLLNAPGVTGQMIDLGGFQLMPQLEMV
jgi:NAD(P)-dependent dehydrogenase (short-subunit alcohol dehydrogenase family)